MAIHKKPSNQNPKILKIGEEEEEETIEKLKMRDVWFLFCFVIEIEIVILCFRVFLIL